MIMRKSKRIQAKEIAAEQQNQNHEVICEKLAMKDDPALLEEFVTKGMGKGIRVSIFGSDRSSGSHSVCLSVHLSLCL